MDHLEDFREMVNGIDDKELLQEGLYLLRDIMQIHEMEERIKELKAELTTGQRAIFYFFADALDKDEVPFAAERISGRIKRLERSEPNKDQ